MSRLSPSEVRAINACGRYMLAAVLRHAAGDCTNGGVSSRVGYVLVPHPEGPHENRDADDPTVMVLLPPAFEGCPLRLRPRVEQGHTMAGGNWCASSDSRWVSLYGGPLSIHDRKE